MHNVYQLPYLNFDNHLDITGLLSIKKQISAFIALHPHLTRPTKYVGGNFTESNSRGILDYQLEYSKHADPVIQELLAKDAFGSYIVFEESVTHGSLSLNLRYTTTGYQDKHKSANCSAVKEDAEFAFFYHWLDSQKIFSDYGRVNIFINHPGTFTHTHKDYPTDDTSVVDQFLWITFNDRKKFFLLDGEEKIYLPGYCNWFNTHNLHGTDPVEQSCYTIRVDGTFSDEFMSKVNPQFSCQ